MDFPTLVRSRRTHKAYAPAPVDRATLDGLFELARWAPNHNLTNPWRFRVLGPEALAALKAAAGPEAAAKLDRAPTLVAASVVVDDDPVTAEEDRDAAACACYIVLLAAHDRGLGGYWRTPGVLRTPEGRAACGIPDGEAVLGLLHLGEARGGKPAPERAPLDVVVAHLPMLARADALAALADEPFDVLVIGGGITGAGVALDAASRGYSVALVEKGDYARGTSSRSSKLVHGGLRYLQTFDLGLVREALLERRLLAALAPHLVRPLPFVVPAFDGARPDRLLGLALNMYDVMAVDGRRRRRGREEDWSPERHRIVDGDEVLELLPALAARRPTGGYLFYDCQTDDVRLVLTVLAEAERFGAVAANRVEAVALAPGGAVLRDAVGGGELQVRAANVVNATGVWADRLRPEELHGEAEVPAIRPSRGTHVLVAAEALPVRAGAIAPAGGGRSVFVLPWLGRTLIGTTDNDYDGDIEHVRPAQDDVDYLLDACNAFFGTAVGRADATGAYAGVRPLIASGDPKKSVDISRKAELYETSSGMITITGGKLTTWRRMAKLAVDRIVEREGRQSPCRTHEIPLGLAVQADALPRVDGVPEDAYPQLAGRYGHAARDVLALAAERAELAGPVLPGLPDLLAEAVFAARREQAETVGDVLLRRTRVGLTGARALCAPGAEAIERVAAVLGAEHGWDRARVAAEAAAFRDEAAAEGLVL